MLLNGKVHQRMLKLVGKSLMTNEYSYNYKVSTPKMFIHYKRKNTDFIIEKPDAKNINQVMNINKIIKTNQSRVATIRTHHS